MELFQVGTDPWGQEIIIRLAWGLLTLSFWAGIAFVVFHAAYAVVWKPRVEPAGAAAAAAALDPGIPERIVRHNGAARMFHWVMAASMLALLVTGFFPIVGLEFSWLTIHWVSGLILILCIIYHIVHASFFLDFWSIWILPSDLAEAAKRVKRQLGQADAEVPKHGKYPLDHKLYHTAVSLAGLAVVGTGIVMMFRIENALLARNAYLLEEETWGLMYVLHGLGAVLFVMLTLTHIYFAVRPDKFWLTKAMIFGSVNREQYLAHHDPKRWVVPQDSTKS
jgi:cytochrome b subunit of formate dehydrogenase